MVDAAKLMETAPMALQLRFLQTMNEISEENATFAFMPLPMELLDVFKGMGSKMKRNSGDDENGNNKSIEE
jgi:hypothetical protein